MNECDPNYIISVIQDIKNIDGTQKIFNQRAKMNTLAAQGKWSKELESQ